MSRMRKVLLSVLSTLFLICLSLAAVSCGDEIKINKAENTYEYSYRKCGKSIRKGDKLYRIFVQLV